ncbi:GrpB protein [Epibacterium ulvae]|uniref:GrpB protein n=1 Tax=Epibacterium ulvae TaxID=1156985 RepID=A0A1G5QI35_9RHOB|nr:GrpB protein [Epibacterium ulvae]
MIRDALDIELRHTGSILAKPIIDLLGVVSDPTALDARSDAFMGIGYAVMEAYDIDRRPCFRKVNGLGAYTHHLHIYETKSAYIKRYLAFRDYLIACPSKPSLH